MAGELMRGGLALCDVARAAAFAASHPGAPPYNSRPTSSLPDASAPPGPQGAAGDQGWKCQEKTAATCLLWPAACGAGPEGSGVVDGPCGDLAGAEVAGPIVHGVQASSEGGQLMVSRGAVAGWAGLGHIPAVYAPVGPGGVALAPVSQLALTACWGTAARHESMGSAKYDPDRRGYRIFIGNLAGSTSHDDLANLFTPYGPIVDVWLASNPPGFGFVVFKSAADAERAVEEKNNSTYMGRVVKVQHARMFKDRTAKPAPAAVHNALDKVRSRSSSSRSRSRTRSRSGTSRSRSVSSDRMSFFSKVYGSSRGRSRTSSRSESRARSWSGSSFLTISAASSGSSSRSGSDSRSRSRSHSRCSSRRHQEKRRSHSSRHRRRHHHHHHHRRDSGRDGRQWRRRQRGLHSSASSGDDQDRSEGEEAEAKGRTSGRSTPSGSSRSGSHDSSSNRRRTSPSRQPDDEALTLAAVPSRRGRRDPPEVSPAGRCRHCRHCARRGSPTEASPARSRRSSRRSRRRQHKRGWRQDARSSRRTSSRTSSSSSESSSSLSLVTKRPCLALEWTSAKYSGSEKRQPKNHLRQQADEGQVPASPGTSSSQQSDVAEQVSRDITAAAARQPRADVDNAVAAAPSTRPSQAGRKRRADPGGNRPSPLPATTHSARQPDPGASLQHHSSNNHITSCHSQSRSKSLIHGDVIKPSPHTQAVCADDNTKDNQIEDRRVDVEPYQRHQPAVLNTKDGNDNITRTKHHLFTSASYSSNVLEVPETVDKSGNAPLNKPQDQWPQRSVGKTQIKFSLSRNSPAFEVVARAQRQAASANTVDQEGGRSAIVQHQSQSRTEGDWASSPKAYLETAMCSPLSPQVDRIKNAGSPETILAGAMDVNCKTIADVQPRNATTEEAIEKNFVFLSTSRSNKEGSASLNLASTSRIDDVHIENKEINEAGAILLTSTMEDAKPELRHHENVCTNQHVLATKPVDGETGKGLHSPAITCSPNGVSPYSPSRRAGHSHADAKHRQESIPSIANSATKSDADTNAHTTTAISSSPYPDSFHCPDGERIIKAPGLDSFSASLPGECAFDTPTKESRKEKSYRTRRRSGSRTPQLNQGHGHRTAQLQRPRSERGKHPITAPSRPGEGLGEARSLSRASDKDERQGRRHNPASTCSPLPDVSRKDTGRDNVLDDDDRMRAKKGRLETEDAGWRNGKTASRSERQRDPQRTVTNDTERSSSSRGKESSRPKRPPDGRTSSIRETIPRRDFGQRQERESGIKRHKSSKIDDDHCRSRSTERQRLRGVAVWPPSKRDDTDRDGGVAPRSSSFSKKASPITKRSQQRPDKVEDRDDSSSNTGHDSNMKIRQESKTQRLRLTEDRKEHRPKNRSESNSSGHSLRDLKEGVEDVAKPPKRKKYVRESLNGEQERVSHDRKRKSSAEELKSGLKTNCGTNNSNSVSDQGISSSSRDPKPKLKSAISLTKKGRSAVS